MPYDSDIHKSVTAHSRGSSVLPPRKSALRHYVTAAAAAAAAAGGIARFGLTADGAIAAFFAAVLVVLAAIDFERRIIPNRIVLPATAVVLIAHVAVDPSRWYEWVLAAVAVFSFFLLVNLVYPAGIGMGDVKLGALIGAGLGREAAIALFVGFVAAAAVAIGIIVREGASARKKPMPFGPFLALGALLTLYSQGF